MTLPPFLENKTKVYKQRNTENVGNREKMRSALLLAAYIVAVLPTTFGISIILKLAVVENIE